MAASGAAASGVGARLVVPEPVVPVVGSDGGVFASGVVVAGVSGAGIVAGGVCCGVSWATAVPPSAARAANAISFIKLLLNNSRTQPARPGPSTQEKPESLLSSPRPGHSLPNGRSG
ncbi:hypothetical protein BXU08_19175 [Sphingomonas sp. LM7]|nr:hypothetical protein BXU08_19175 [Sphingomonas sp. LM7]